MYTYDKLLNLVKREGIAIDEKAILKEGQDGYYIEITRCNIILLNKNIKTNAKRRCTLGEELGHHFTTSGDITDQTKLENRKQERTARKWSYEKLVPLQLLAEAINYPCQNKTELAEYLEVTEEYLEEALKYYKERYGQYCTFNEYTIWFEPLRMMKIYNNELNL